MYDTAVVYDFSKKSEGKMIVAEEKHDFTSVGNFQKKQFNFHVNAKAYKMLFNNIYTNKVEAIVREYSTNAYDAHVQAGIKDRPFVVDLPTTFVPTFRVRDFGKGLNQQEIEEVFCSFFYSTKTSSNDFVGCLGLGSCSAFSLVESFLVNSYQNGTVKRYSCYLSDDGCPSVSMLTSDKTDQEDGLEIIVNVSKHHYDFINAAGKVYKWFDVKPIINDPSVKASFEVDDYIFKGDDFAFNPNYGTTKAVMGNVAYSIPENIINCCGYIKFNIGDLEFDPGREKLSLDTKTFEFLKNKVQEVKAKIGDKVKEELNLLPTKFQRHKEFRQIDAGFLHDYVKHLSKTYIISDPKEFSYYNAFSSNIQSSMNMPSGKSVELFLNDCHVPKERIRHYCKKNSVTVVLLTKEQIDTFEIQPDEYQLISSIPKIQKVKTNSKPIKIKSIQDFGLKEDYLDINEPFVYVNMERGNTVIPFSTLRSLISILRKSGYKEKIYALSKSNPKKVFKNGTELVDYIKKNVKIPEKLKLRPMIGLSYLKAFDDRFKENEVDPNYEGYIFLGVKHDDSLEELKNRYFKENPILSIVSRAFLYANPSSEELKTIKNLIKEVK